MRKQIILSLVLLMISTLAFAQTTFMENKPWKEVKAAAIKANKPIFMDCYTTWCGPCKRLATVIFPKKEVGEYLNANFVCCKYDMEKGDGEMLHKKYGANIPGFPTMLIIDPSTEQIIHHLVGAQEADVLLSRIKEGMSGETVAAYQKRFESGERSVEFINGYIHVLDVAYDSRTKEKVVKSYVESLPNDSLLNKDIITMYLPYLKDVHAPRYKFVLDNISKYQYLLKMDRYKIEYKLSETMTSAQNDLVNLYKKNSTNADSISYIKKEADFLRTMLNSDVKGFNKVYAKLAILDVCMTNDMVALDKILDVDDQLHATDDEFMFRPKMYDEIIRKADNKKNKDIVAKYVAKVQSKQDKYDARSKGEISMFSINDYDLLAIGYSRVGDKKKAEECAKKWDERYKVQMVSMKKLFGESAESEIEKVYNERKSKMMAAIGKK